MSKRKPEGLFVTGVDTEVGKTFVSCALARAMRCLGLDVGVMKPVASGCRRRGGKLISGDARALIAACGTDDGHDDVCPLRFAAPIGPSVAARREGRRLTFSAVMRSLSRLSGRHDFMLVEGVGGLAVPLSRRRDVADLAVMIGFPVLIVAADRLGVLNHTLLTVEHARAKGLEVRGILLNRISGARDASQSDNARELKRLGVPVLGRLGFCRSPEAAARQISTVARSLIR